MMNLENNNLKIIPISDIVLLEGMDFNLPLKGFSQKQIDFFNNQDNSKVLVLTLKKNFKKVNLKEDDFYRVGSLIKIIEIEKKNDIYMLNIKVENRVEVKNIKNIDGEFFGEYTLAPDVIDLDSRGQKEIIDYIKNTIHEISSKFQGSEPFVKILDDINDLNKLMGYASQYMPKSNADKYILLEINSLKERSLRFIDYLLEQREAIKLQVELSEKFNEKANKNYRENMLREQLKAIQSELNEKYDESDGNEDYNERIKNSGMPEEVEKVAFEELTKLSSQNPNSSDYNVIRNYLDTLLALPWKESAYKDINLGDARRTLDEEHFGLEKVKERIIQHLAVMKLKKNKRGSILLLVGPPGTGKTSLGKSIAKALDRKYIRMSLGGIRDEAEIRGHRRTYVGAMPGRIIKGLKQAGENNAVFVLDEVDKLVSGYNGDPASALLEVLDPEQNNTFTDNYLDVPFDLSNIFFIATANSLEGIPRPLLDRMEIIPISSYTSNEKFHIGKNHLIQEVLDEHGLTLNDLTMEDDTLQTIIDDYTREAGVRGLRRQLATIARVSTEKIVSNKVEVPYNISSDMLEDMLGRKISRHDMTQESNPPGVVTGLAWTPVGGEILFVEGTFMTGSGQLLLTGKLGEVMKESARISLSLIKSRLALNAAMFNFKEKDLHIHVPSGAVPKDGPSAGITLLTAIASLVTGIKVDPKLAMTGEVTLRGAVLPIGGLKEKLLAAHRAGVKKVLIPKDNVEDLKDLPDEVKNDLTIIPVEFIEEVFNEALGVKLPKSELVLGDNKFFLNEGNPQL
ncbi:endopeptidase La [Clostridium grantii]|uniref:Lon protease n=1 Tax=Clostridium grantii DSM 8605 TaxID=1121316 RepID=A0A1M5VQ03_9CLOT|nr:endopeptidase La [Clostridium grantii]SHH77339.1 ATP-dependent Lon protease [Clostridium grantii DSM 8605]